MEGVRGEETPEGGLKGDNSRKEEGRGGKGGAYDDIDMDSEIPEKRERRRCPRWGARPYCSQCDDLTCERREQRQVRP